MADLSHLGNLKTTAPLDLPMYTEARAPKPFPKAGRYTARTSEQITFGESQAGYLTADVSPTIVGGEFDGYKINFVKVSAKDWINKDGKSESQLGRYLKAAGLDVEVEGNPQAQADAAEQTANTLIDVDADWIAKYQGKVILKGMKNFPIVDGQPSRFVTLDGKDGRPEATDPLTGEPVTTRAFLEVVRFHRAS